MSRRSQHTPKDSAPGIALIAVSLVVVVVVVVLIPAKPWDDVLTWDFALELAIAVVCFSYPFFVIRAGLSGAAFWVLFGGVSSFALSTLLDLLDERHLEHQPLLANLESVLSLAGVVGIAVGLWLWQRENRRTLGVLAQSKTRYQQLSQLDSMTGVFNRGHFNRILEERVNESRDRRRSLAMLMFDIDGFKLVNDEHGHRIGDEVISALATCMRQQIRGGDLAFRYGGDEFVILLECKESADVEQAGERVRNCFASRSFDAEDGRIQCTVSAGAAILRPGEPSDGFIDRADQALRAAKAAGRDRLIMAEIGISSAFSDPG